LVLDALDVLDGVAELALDDDVAVVPLVLPLLFVAAFVVAAPVTAPVDAVPHAASTPVVPITPPIARARLAMRARCAA
jgi:hypothetical protein